MDNDIIDVRTTPKKKGANKLALTVFLIFAAIASGMIGGGVTGGGGELVLMGIGVITVGAILMAILQKKER